MANILLQVLRNRMMIDRGIAEEIYLPWLTSVLDGSLPPGMLMQDKGKFEPMAYAMDKKAFSMGGRSAIKAMDMATDGSVAVIPIMGEFMKHGSDCAYGAMDIVPALYKAGDMKEIVAVVLDVDSGGGSENAVPPFIEAIKYIQSKGKPVVLHGDLVASAAYYIATYCNFILADNIMSSAFGSVGVYISFMDYKEKLEKEGVKLRTIYAPQSTLKNHEYRELTDNDNETPLINDVLVPSADRFIASVKENRKGRIAEDSDVFKGKLYEGQAIVNEGLADGFGTLWDAISIAAGMTMYKK